LLWLGACAASGDDDDSVEPGKVDSSWKVVKKKPSCDTQSLWRLASYFNLARDVDYVADRINTEVISESGEACASASDREQCKTELATVPGDASMFAQLGHHLVTIEGDSVRIWIPQSVMSLFGDIDTPGEAIWILVAGGYIVGCDAEIDDAGEDGFAIAVDQPDTSCPQGRGFRIVTVTVKGSVYDNATQGAPAVAGCADSL
jgi:hypothetical protein